jgi:hypothetical protein
LLINQLERRGSNSSQGSNSSATLAADQRKRRKEQNRAAQRAFRERKEKYVKELEDKIKEIEAAHAIQVSKLEKENKGLKAAMKEMDMRMHQLKGAAATVAYEVSLNKAQQQQQSPAVSVTEEIGSTATATSPRATVNNSNSLSSASATTTPRVRSSAVACIRDKDGVSFCERLKEEVCSNAYDQLLTEPLFDSHGFLNETVASHPVPIVTGTKEERSRTDIFNELEQSLTANLSPTIHEANGNVVDLISCSVVWNRIAKHPLFDKFDLEDLCDELKKIAKCSRSGPVFEEYEVQEVLTLMEERVKKHEQEQKQQQKS